MTMDIAQLQDDSLYGSTATSWTTLDSEASAATTTTTREPTTATQISGDLSSEMSFDPQSTSTPAQRKVPRIVRLLKSRRRINHDIKEWLGQQERRRSSGSQTIREQTDDDDDE